MRDDAFVLGQDPRAGKEEAVDGCAKCGKCWPAVRFSKAVAEDQLGESGKPILCDSCFPSELETEIAQKIDEATGAAPATPLVREVTVTGIESKTNVIGFSYPTHVNGNELLITDITVMFKGKDSPKPIRYLFKNVPTVICEGWMGSPSAGKYFVEQIKSSYECQRLEVGSKP